MSRVKLIFKGVTEVVGAEDVGLIVLVDEEEKRQLVIPCDQNMLSQFELRIQHQPIVQMMLPEVLWNVIQSQTSLHFEIIINDLIKGQYKAIFYNINTMDMLSIRVSDALLLAQISNIPVYIDEDLMRKQSVEYNKDSHNMALPVNTITDDMLKSALEKAIQEENYELASHLRDEMKRRNLPNA